MSFRFEFVGKLRVGKDGEKFKAFEEKVFPSGWAKRTLRLVIDCGEDKFYPTIQGGLTKDKIVYSVANKENGGKGIKFPYSQKSKYIDKIAEFKKFVFVDGQERHEFVNEWDFSKYVHDVLQTGEFDDKLLRCMGEVTYYNSTNKDGEVRTYKNYEIHRIYVVTNDEVTPYAKGNCDVYYNSKAIDKSKMNEGVLLIKGYVGCNDSKKKGDIGYPETFEYILPEEEDKREVHLKAIEKRLAKPTDDKMMMTGLDVRLESRTTAVEFDMSMLSEEDQFDLDMGLTTLDQLKEEYGCGKGDTIKKNIITTWKSDYRKAPKRTVVTLGYLLSDGTEESPKQDTPSQDVDVDFGETNDIDDLGIDVDDLFAD